MPSMLTKAQTEFMCVFLPLSTTAQKEDFGGERVGLRQELLQ